MPHPKKKTTSSVGGQRRSHDHLNAVHASNCPKCSEPKLAHRACQKCGFYKDSQVIDTAKATERILRKSSATTEVVEEKPKAEKKKPAAKKAVKKAPKKEETKKEEAKEEKAAE
jgi:large subunit ribosomal protein L32